MISVNPAEEVVGQEVVQARIAGLALREAVLTEGKGKVTVSVYPIYASTFTLVPSSQVCRLQSQAG